MGFMLSCCIKSYHHGFHHGKDEEIALIPRNKQKEGPRTIYDIEISNLSVKEKKKLRKVRKKEELKAIGVTTGFKVAGYGKQDLKEITGKGPLKSVFGTGKQVHKVVSHV